MAKGASISVERGEHTTFCLRENGKWTINGIRGKVGCSTNMDGFATYWDLTLSVSTFDVTVGALCKGVRQKLASGEAMHAAG